MLSLAETFWLSTNRVKKRGKAVAENSEETAKRETWGRPFQPGKSGNPGDRPKVIAEVRDLARQHTALAIETLVHIMQHGDKDAARVTAARAILDRAWGKTVQPLGTEGGVVQCSVSISTGRIASQSTSRAVRVL